MSVEMPQRCPVPAEQQPINEYQDVSGSWFYGWGSRSLWGYLKPVIVLWLVGWGIAGPMAAASFAPAKHPLPFALSAAMGAMVLPLLALLQLLCGLVPCGGAAAANHCAPTKSLAGTMVSYGSSPEEVSNRDRLIVDYQVLPVLRRIRRTIGAMAALLGLGLMSWQLL